MKGDEEVPPWLIYFDDSVPTYRRGESEYKYVDTVVEAASQQTSPWIIAGVCLLAVLVCGLFWLLGRASRGSNG